MSTQRILASMSLLAITMGVSISGHADKAELEEIVVTAQKRDQSQQDVPIAMDAFTAEDVQNRQISGVADLAVTIPSLRIGEAIGAQQISLRGVGYGLFSGAGENAVAVHIDGVYLANPGSVQLMQSDLAGIEVLRGPQGTLWGRNATGGVINFITPAPAEEFEAEINVGVGNYNARTVSANASLPISDVVKARLSLDSLERDGYIENRYSGEDIAGINKFSGRLAVDITPSDNLQIATRFFSSDEDWDGPYFSVLDDSVLASFSALNPQYDSDPRKLYANYEPEQNSSLDGGSVRVDWAINDIFRLVSITGLMDYNRTQDYDNDGSSANTVLVQRDISDQTFSQEFNLSGQWGNLEILIGAYYLKQETDIYTTAPLNDTVVFTGLYELRFDFDEEVESQAIFFDATYKLTDNLSLYGGLRALEEERSGSFALSMLADLGALPFLAFQGAGAGANPADYGLTVADLIDVSANGFTNYLTGSSMVIDACAQPIVSNNSKDSATTGRIGLNYQVADDVMTYTQFSTGYKSGGFATSGCDDPFEPEELNAYEVGFKSELFDNTLRLNGAAYFYDYQNLQVEQGLGTQIVVENADAEIKGIDLDAVYLASESLRLNVGLAWIDAEYTDFTNIDSISDPLVTQDVSGNPLSRSPEWSLVFGAEYEWILQQGGSWVVRADVMFSDSYQTREFDKSADEQPSYQNVNAVATYRSPGDRWTAGLWVKNLTDEEVLQNIVEVSVLAGSGAPGVRAGTHNLPRMFGANVAYQF